MSAARVRLLLLALLSIVFVGGSPPRGQAETKLSTKPRLDTQTGAAALAKMPVRFEANVGQHDGSIRFVARRGAVALALRDAGATLMIQQRALPTKPATGKGRPKPIVIGLSPDGARSVAPQASDELVTKTNYLIGNDPSKWHRDVANYAKVTYPSVLDGVDLVYHGENGLLEYDFVVAPGASVDRIAMNVDGASEMSITEKGDLQIHTDAGDVVQPPPLVYQRDAAGAKRTVVSSYRLVGKSKVGFEVAAYDRSRPLVIDPILGYATYLGGSDYDTIRAVTADGAGNTYLTGVTYSTDFPTANAYDSTFNICGECSFGTDLFVAKLNPTGSQLLYSTFIGGEDTDEAAGIAVAADDTAYVTGTTSSYDFPVVNPLNGFTFTQDGFVARLNAAGNDLAFSTYLAGSSYDTPTGIALDATGIYIAGYTSSTDLTNPQIIDRASPQGGASGSGQDSDAFIVKLTTSAITWVKYLGGTSDDYATSLALDGAGRAYISGFTFSGDFPQGASPLKASCDVNGESTDAFVARLNATGTAFEYVTCLGGTDQDSALGIAVDSTGAAYVTGETYSSDFPVVGSTSGFGGQSDVFVSKLNAAGSALVYSRLIGGSNNDYANGIAVDTANTAWVTGATGSANYPTVVPVQGTFAGGGEVAGDAFVTRVNATGATLIFSTFYGGSDDWDEGTAIAAKGTSIHVAGRTYSTNLPVLNAHQATNAGQQDGFVAKITVPPLLISPASALVPVGQSQQFTAVGGAGFGYLFGMQSAPSGGSVSPTGLYTAGGAGSTVDVVQVTDAAGQTATATVQVGPNTTALVISPINATTAPKGQKLFTASGGVAPYSFGFTSNASGATITPAGAYTAGAKGGVVDVVRLTDSVGTAVQATVVVSGGITITPAKPATPPNGSVSFSATGGSGTGYTWSISQNKSGGSIVAGTGTYTAGSGSNTVDTVQVTDSLGNKASVNVSVGGGLAISPSDPSASTRGAIAFEAFGGSGVYTWSLTTAPSGGTIQPDTGAYVAGTTGDTMDTVRVQDSLGNSSSVQVSVGPSLTISPDSSAVLAGATVAFAGAGGSGAGYAFTLVTSESGGSVASDGVYTAGPASGADVVRLTDSLGNTDDATVTVTAAPGTLPDGGAFPGFDAGTIPGLNIGGGGVDEDCSCRAVGASSHGAHAGSGFAAALSLMLGLVMRRRRRR